jgi:tRNA threonylcarbamoyladenosine biosynthesis protein TsaB
VAELLAEAGLAAAQLDGLVCGIGPGSFAGVRIGVGFVQGMATALDRPVLGISALELLALPAIAEGFDSVLAVIDARMSEVYCAGYAAVGPRRPGLRLGPRVGPPARLAGLDHPSWSIGVGSGWRVHGESLRTALGAAAPAIERPDALPDIADGMATAALRLGQGAGGAAETLQPLYLRNKVALTLDEQQAARRRDAGD